MKRSHLYVLVYPDKKLLKIGKANDVVVRAHGLQKYWGKPDYEHSWSLEIDADQVFKIEKALHLLLAKHAAGLSEGDGKTEFFAIECLGHVLEHLEVFTKQSKYYVLEQGINAPEMVVIQKPVDKQLKRYTRGCANLKASWKGVTKNLELSMRVIGILIKHKERINYHYKIDGDDFNFYIKDKRLLDLTGKLQNLSKSLFAVSETGFGKNIRDVVFFDRVLLDGENGSLSFTMKVDYLPFYSSGPLSGFLNEQYRHIIFSLLEQSALCSQDTNVEVGHTHITTDHKMKRSRLYILVYTQKNVIKIGKANDVTARIVGLKKHWGEPDYENSYSLEIGANQVFKIEKALHLFLDEHAAGLSEGDGKTEFFAIECLDQVLEYLEVFTKRSDYHILKKGIKAPEINASEKTRDIKFIKYTDKQKRLSEVMNDTTKNLDFLMRIVGILQKHREQIKYYYKIDGDYLTFTLEDKRLTDLASKNIKSVFELFYMADSGFHTDSGGINLIDSSGGGDAMHSRNFLIRIDKSVYKNTGLLIDFLTEQYRQIILSLPEQSPAYIRTLNSN